MEERRALGRVSLGREPLLGGGEGEREGWAEERSDNKPDVKKGEYADNMTDAGDGGRVLVLVSLCSLSYIVAH